jgi:hypothetical protein
MLSVVPFSAEWSGAVKEFNRRLAAGGLDPELRFPEEPKAEFPAAPESPLRQEFFLAVEGAAVRGAYFLTFEPWSLAGQPCMVANYRLPLSEGLVDPAWRGVNLVLLRDALKRSPLLYCLGMGGYDRPLPRSLQALKWPMFATSFFFHAVRPGRVLRNLSWLRGSRWRRLVLDLAAFSGAGWAAFKLASAWRRRGRVPEFRVRLEPEFGGWADALWAQLNNTYEALAVRQARLLNLRYPPADPRFLRLRVDGPAGPLGWAVLLATRMRAHKHFGNLRVGALVDGLARPEHAAAVVRAAFEELQRRDVDLMVTNQTHTVWCRALRRAGFIEGPSNRIFAASPKLAERLAPWAETQGRVHLTRGDGAGPIHL